jgi:shikimate kinase
MASGKSNFGRVLAEKLEYGFVDLDYLFEERFRISVLDFFEKYDEIAFRKIERGLLLETLSRENLVISTGGGTPCFFDNMDVIKHAGISVYLYWETTALVRRLKIVKRRRPLLKDVLPADLGVKVAAHLIEREVYYNQADIKVPGENFDVEVLKDQIMNHLNRD